MCKFNACDASTYKCKKWSTTKSVCKDRKAANMHKILHYNVKLKSRLGTHAIDGNATDEINEEKLALNSDFEVNDAEREVNQMNFLSDLSLEDDKFKSFIKILDEDMARKHLVAASQDRCFSEIRCNNLSKGDVDLQIN